MRAAEQFRTCPEHHQILLAYCDLSQDTVTRYQSVLHLRDRRQLGRAQLPAETGLLISSVYDSMVRV